MRNRGRVQIMASQGAEGEERRGSVSAWRVSLNPQTTRTKTRTTLSCTSTGQGQYAYSFAAERFNERRKHTVEGAPLDWFTGWLAWVLLACIATTW